MKNMNTEQPSPKPGHHTEDELRAATHKVAAAIRKLAMASSSNFGRDCVLHASLAKVLLADLGIESERVAGQAAWRIGPGDGDVISHLAGQTGIVPQGKTAFPFHAWLVVGSRWVVDVTTYQLPMKARTLDALDGGTTLIEWAPEYLLIATSAVRSLRDVRQFGTGLAYYEAIPGLDEAAAQHYALSPTDVQVARMLVSNNHIEVVGPTQMASHMAHNSVAG